MHLKEISERPSSYFFAVKYTEKALIDIFVHIYISVTSSCQAEQAQTEDARRTHLTAYRNIHPTDEDPMTLPKNAAFPAYRTFNHGKSPYRFGQESKGTGHSKATMVIKLQRWRHFNSTILLTPNFSALRAAD